MTKVILVVLLTLFICSPVFSQTEDFYIPEDLEPWVDWVRDRNPELACPEEARTRTRLDCAWIRSIQVNHQQAPTPISNITLVVDVFADSMISLPFSESTKPQSVQVNQIDSPISGGNGQPQLHLPAGHHIVSLVLQWNSEESARFIDLPSAGIVSYELNKVAVTTPLLTDQGTRLWLIGQQENQENLASRDESNDAIDTKVFRYLIDDVPQQLITFVQLTVAGRARVVNLGKVLPDHFVSTRLNSQYPLMLDDRGTLVVQVRPGTNNVVIHSRSTELIDSVTVDNDNEYWPAEEIWGVQLNPHIRVVRLEAPRRTDLTQVDVPAALSRLARQLNGFLLQPGETLSIVEEQQGNVNPKPPQLHITRELWLNFAGDSFVAVDSIESELFDNFRLIARRDPGKIRVDGRDRLVTYGDSQEETEPGINLTSNAQRINVVSKFERTHTLFASGWDVDVESLNTTLHLPPGWQLFWAGGVDFVEETWLSQWDVWKLFLLLVLMVLVLRLGGVLWCCIVGVTIVLSHPFTLAISMSWTAFAGIALLRSLTDNERWRLWLKQVLWCVFVVIAFTCLATSTLLVRNAIYPQLSEQRIESFHAFEIQKLGIESMDERFRTLPSQYKVTDPPSAADEEVVMTTGSRMSGAQDLATVEGTEHVQNVLRTPINPMPDFSESRTINIQTGPGTPTWSGSAAMLGWNGNVRADQKVTLMLLPPWLTQIIAGVAAIFILTVLIYWLCTLQPNLKRCLPSFLKPLSMILPCLLIFLVCRPTDIQADFPDSTLLKELEQRLVHSADCDEECAYLERAVISIEQDELSIALRIHAEEYVAVPLPTANETWSLYDASIDDVPIPLHREQDDLYTVLDAGIHDLVLKSNVTAVNRIEVTFPLLPSAFNIDADGWQSEGLIRNQLDGRQIALERTVKVLNDQVEDPALSIGVGQPIQPYVAVHRQLILAYEPQLVSTVSRIAPYRGEFSVRIPLLDFEQVRDQSHNVEDREMVVTFGNYQDSYSWVSDLNLEEHVVLTAPPLKERSERWSLLSSEYWLYDHEGLTPIQSDQRTTTFVPRSNESVALSFRQPRSIPGTTITVENARVRLTSKNRNTDAELSLKLYASQPGEFIVYLPDEVNIKAILANDDDLPIPITNKVLLPVRTGTNDHRIKWEAVKQFGIFHTTPSIELGQESRNVYLSIQIPENRWLLFLGGPYQGPVTMYWLIAVVMILVGFMLTRLNRTPFSIADALILGLGAAITNVWVVGVVLVWMIGLWWRGQNNIQFDRKLVYRIQQIISVVVGLAAIALLITALVDALVSNPDMHIAGMSSTPTHLKWFSDEADLVLPTAWIITLPGWVYFVLILFWSLWLALALFKWTKTSWEVLNMPVFWSASESSIEEKE